MTNSKLTDDRIAALLDCVDMCDDMSVDENADMAKALRELQERRKAAELMAEKFIGVDPAFGPDRTVEVRYFAPPGYAMVPKEPTPKQWAAGLKAMNEGVDKVSLVYGAMLSAAPQVLPEVSGE
ncbi:hypothetical protein NPT69_002857 [Salmonella enterica subsp. enterica serovar Yaba]|nr:hypothetical protein [Salmonella enterica subsp. enterica serovar Yaba]